MRREAPQWVADFLGKLNGDQLGHLGSGYVLMRDGVVIDQWPDTEEILTVTSEIKPALTAEEWAKHCCTKEGVAMAALPEQPYLSAGDDAVYDDGFDAGPEARHALAALALFGQPFGFDDLESIGSPTTTFVEALRDTADAMDEVLGAKMIGIVHLRGPEGERSIGAHYAEMFHELADRIEAMLPPNNGPVSKG